jgi:hypothetical protein
MSDSKHDIATALTKKLAEEGKLIEGGFAAMQIIMLDGAPREKIDEMRIAYMAGAEHLFSSMIAIMDPGEEPTEADLKRMDLIHAELQGWRDVLAARVGKTGGHA